MQSKDRPFSKIPTQKTVPSYSTRLALQEEVLFNFEFLLGLQAPKNKSRIKTHEFRLCFTETRTIGVIFFVVL